MITKPELLILSGLRSGSHGVGRLLFFLRNQAEKSSRYVEILEGPLSPAELVRSIYKEGGLLKHIRSYKAEMIRFRAKIDELLKMEAPVPLVIIHFQSIGYRLMLNLIKKYPGPMSIYLTDSAFFCLRAYNHIPGCFQACNACLRGKWSNAFWKLCLPRPLGNFRPVTMLKLIKDSVISGRVGIVSQNQRQAELAQEHFGSGVNIHVAGMWTLDVQEAYEQTDSGDEGSGFDVVYHGAKVSAKGFQWALEVAARCPDLEFLFPFTAPVKYKPGKKRFRENIHFLPMTWETGLSQQISMAKVTLVPSIWSAPIESALIKSILLSNMVAVIREPTSFADQLDEEIILHLNPDPGKASFELVSSINRGWQPNRIKKEGWVRNFVAENKGVLNNLFT